MVKKYFGMVHGPWSMVHKHWPGPLSIVLKAKKGIAKAVLLAGTAAVRVPDSDTARTLSKYLGRPLVATSANISGQPACYSVRALLRQFIFVIPSHQTRDPKASKQTSRFLALDKTTRQARNDAKNEYSNIIVLDAGALRRRRPSTIVKIDESGKLEVLRKGPIKFVPN
jgi:tRNA A37 threonylcarbamoyladenosine synthetase subunit TsaC/SUA5/YrdC